jgi:hypothetical protein
MTSSCPVDRMNCTRLETLDPAGDGWQTNVDYEKSKKSVEKRKDNTKVTFPQEMQILFTKREDIMRRR